MYIDVVFSPNEFSSRDPLGKSITVIDVLRATSTIIYALWGYRQNYSPDILGCSKIIPVETLEEARKLAQKYDKEKVLLTGERFCLKPDDFDLGNSPKDYIPEKIQGKTIIFSTTNGTRALKLAEKAEFVTTSSFVNANASANKLYEEQNDVIILCAGRSNKTTKEDSACAGLIVDLLAKKCEANNQSYELSDAADIALKFFNFYKKDIKGLLYASEAGKNLIDVNLESDISDCSTINLVNISTKFENGTITLN